MTVTNEYMKRRILPPALRAMALTVMFLAWPTLVKADATPPAMAGMTLEQACRAISGRLASVALSDCLHGGLHLTQAESCQGFPILIREYPPLAHRQPQARVLVVGGTHGDELSSISIVFKWMQILNEHHSGLFHWMFIPLLNPDGLLRPDATRTNHQGVDLNRNFPSPLWREAGYQRWVEIIKRNPRYYPGPEAMSEPETKYLVRLIYAFKPHAIISVHAPLGLVDYDGPGTPPASLGSLKLRRLGNFPGTLGNFATMFGVPVITIELDSATRMPTAAEISAMWRDLVRWLVASTPPPSAWGVLQAQDDGPMLDKVFFAK